MLSKSTGIIGTIVSVLGILTATNTVQSINDMLAALGAAPNVVKSVGVALAVAGSIVGLFAQHPTADAGK